MWQQRALQPPALQPPTPHARRADVHTACAPPALLSVGRSGLSAVMQRLGAVEEIRPNNGTICGRGTPYRFFAHRADPTKLLVDFGGGGACWSDATCARNDTFLPAALPLAAVRAGMLSASLHGIYALADPASPFFNHSLVFVSYCTGDLHAGDTTVKDRRGRAVHHHRGARNARAALTWAVERYGGTARQVTVAGTSAGAYGAVLHTPHLARAFGNATVRVLADSGYGVLPDGVSAALLKRWNLTEKVLPDTFAVPQIRAQLKKKKPLEMSDVVAAVGAAFPQLRFGLYTTALDRDQTKFYKLLGGDGASFRTRAKTVLRRLADGVPTLRYFRAPGRVHGVHNHDILYARSVGGVRYVDWLQRLLTAEELPPSVDCDATADGCGVEGDGVCGCCAKRQLYSPACDWCAAEERAPSAIALLLRSMIGLGASETRPNNAETGHNATYGARRNATDDGDGSETEDVFNPCRTTAHRRMIANEDDQGDDWEILDEEGAPIVNSKCYAPFTPSLTGGLAQRVIVWDEDPTICEEDTPDLPSRYAGMPCGTADSTPCDHTHRYVHHTAWSPPCHYAGGGPIEACTADAGESEHIYWACVLKEGTMPQTGCQPRAFRVENKIDPKRSSELEYKGWEPNGEKDPVCEEGKRRTWRVNREGCTGS